MLISSSRLRNRIVWSAWRRRLIITWWLIQMIPMVRNEVT